MKVTHFNCNIPGSKILISPLDWGLGHATRCIPIIESLLQQNKKVLVAGDGPGMNIIQSAFPQLIYLPLQGYNISYSKSARGFFIKMLFQLPKITKAILREKKWLKKTIQQYQIDTVISDNRLGFCNNKVYSVFITHQLGIKTGSVFFDKLVQHINYFFINQFDECWVPDYKEENNLAGELSHPKKMPDIPTVYIGFLSRFEKKTTAIQYKWAIVLSGPEPQRTMFEDMIVQQLKSCKDAVLLVRGLPASSINTFSLPKNITVYNHLDKEDLNECMQQAMGVIARSGYSTVMDLITIQQKAVLVPTPGQTEQEYLANYLSEKKIFKTISQKDFHLEALFI